ncbi:hypothetical protein EPD60_12590 [Flaviaesturariibacter flavus]|uniref:Uncharacterized protein n=1 Tax=Flaviaesturariibacter flavus TaxID=2502780 RepID=A0A4R1B8E0_9BACT|nr:hypothetical protein [Flaviaesturariibacter flavus]TCJ13228.1 hypothetical protein EPD60_12590 [Flaviaesturariibacter flavus]
MKFTKTLLAAASALLVAGAAQAQIFDKTKGKNVQKLLSGPAHVYTRSSGPYNDRLRAAFTNYWKATPVEFHDISKSYPRLESSSLVFAPAVVGLTVRDHATAMNNPFYVMAAANQLGEIDGDAIVAAFPINGFHYEFDVTASDNMYDRSLLRIPYMVQTMNEMVTLVKAGGSEKEFFKTVDSRTARIAGKTLLIPAELLQEWDVNPNTTAMMKANLEAGKKPMKAIRVAIMEQGDISFAGKYKVLPAADIMKLEESADADKYTLFLPAIDNKKYVMVYDLKSKELLYFETTNMGMRVKSKDFEKLNKAIGQ